MTTKRTCLDRVVVISGAEPIIAAITEQTCQASRVDKIGKTEFARPDMTKGDE